MERGQLLELDLDEGGGLLGGVVGLGRDRGDRFAVVLRLARGEDGTVAALRTEAGHRVGQVRGGHHEADAGDLERRGGVDPADPGARHVERDELDVEDVVVGHVGDVLLLPGDAGTAADAGCGTRRRSLRRHFAPDGRPLPAVARFARRRPRSPGPRR